MSTGLGGDRTGDELPRETAFRGLVGPRLDRAYRLAWHLLGDAADAEDACQEALLSAWRGWAQLRDPGRFDAWFDRILVNVCTEQLRRRARRHTVELTDKLGITGDSDATWTAERDEIGAALHGLSAEQRTVVVLRYWADLPTDEIAARLGVPAGTVRSRLHYALEALRARLGTGEGTRR